MGHYLWYYGLRNVENIVFTTVLGEENLALLIKHSDDKCPRLLREENPVYILQILGKNHDVCLASGYKSYP